MKKSKHQKINTETNTLWFSQIVEKFLEKFRISNDHLGFVFFKKEN